MKGCLGILASLLMSSGLHATPLWMYSAPNPAQVTISPEGTAIVQYTVTNQSNMPKNLILKTTKGLSASPCYLAGKGSTCLLTLTVRGSLVPTQGIHTGPILCEQSNPNQCYQPSQANSLDIFLMQSHYLVIPSTGAHVTIVPSGIQSVAAGSTQQFTVSVGTGYVVEGIVGGTCPIGQWSGATYTTGAITYDCTVSFNAILQQTSIVVTPSTITLTTNPGNSTTVTVTNNGPVDAYNVSATLASPNYGVVVSGTTCDSILEHTPPNNTCNITFEMGAGGTVGTTSATIQGTNTNLQSLAISVVPIAPILSIISPAQADRIISVNNGPLDIVVRNDAQAALSTNITASLPIAWGSDVIVSYSNCTGVMPGNSCTIHLESAAPFIADQITINGTNGANSLTTYIAFRYQGGLVFAANKVMTETNIASIMWGPFNIIIGGINENSTAGIDSCDGKNDGVCNTLRIVDCFTNQHGCQTPPSSPVNINTYAAGLCSQYNDGTYSDWYLPAICEWSNVDNNCSIDNIYSNLMQYGFGYFVDNISWSSTDYSAGPANAWAQYHNNGNFEQNFLVKSGLNGVRCVRNF